MKKNYIWKNIRSFNYNSIFFRYLFGILFIILIVFIPYIIIIDEYSDTMLEKEISIQASNNIIKSKKIFDLLTTGFINNYPIVAEDEDVYNFLSYNQNDTMSEQYVLSCQKTLQSIQRNNIAYEDVMIYSIKNDYYLSTNSISQYNKNSQIQWISTYLSTKLPFIMFPRKVKSDLYDTIFTVQEIYDTDGKVIGIFAIQMEYSVFSNLVNQSFEEKPEKIYIVSDIGLTLYSSESSRINTIMFEDPVIYPIFQAIQKTNENTLLWENNIIAIARSNNSKLLLMSFYSKEQLMGHYDLLQNMIKVGSIAVLFAAIISALFIAFDHYRSVSSVLKVIEDTKDSNELISNSKLNNEISYIIRFLISSADQAQKLDLALIQKIQQLQQAHLCELQAQISPHFIFNTLQSINFSILRQTHQDTPATKMISLLSDLLRSVYDTDRVIISVEEELENSKKFIEIQALRYKGRLHVEYNIDEKCLHFCTLKMMLQPFIENSIVHGFENCEQEWKLSISCKLESNFVVFNIIDNGTGISEEQLQIIRQKISSFNIYGKNIGISNVSQRLKLLFNNNYLIDIDACPQSGTSITIQHPAVTNHPFIEWNHALNNM